MKEFFNALLSKLQEIYDILLIFVGIALAVFVSTQGIKYKDFSLPINDLPWRVGLGVFALVLIAIGIVIRLRSTGKATLVLPDKDDVVVKITHPEQNKQVSTITVEGTIEKDVPEDYVLWILRIYPDNRFYPLRKCIFKDKKNWYAPDCDAGGKLPNNYRAFAAVLVGPDGGALINFVREANARFGPIRNELISLKPPKSDVPHLPTVGKATRDMIFCDQVVIEPM